MNQLSFAKLEHSNKKRKSRRESFLDRIDSLIPWGLLLKLRGQSYPKANGTDLSRRPSRSTAHLYVFSCFFPRGL